MILESTKNDNDQYIACRRLLAAVVGLAMRDACQYPGRKTINEIPRTAMDFIFKYSDGYLTLLDIDPVQFRKRLVNLCYDNSNKFRSASGLNKDDLRKFRVNYQLWLRSKGQKVEVEEYYE